MNNRLLLYLVALLSLALTAARVAAQGTVFTYQGRLNDNGVPANGNYGMIFYLCDSPATGGQLANLGIVNVPVSNGLFTVALDFGNLFDGSSRWLEIAVQTNGAGSFTTLSPRQSLTATPYAITASNISGTLPATQISGTILPANIGVGTISGSMLANGAVGTNQLAAGAVNTAKMADGAVTATKMTAVGVARSLMTYTNPTPAEYDEFGISVAAMGDRVLIGEIGGDTGATDAGTAYLFSTNGALLTTFTNPTPAMNDFFGRSLAAVGNGRVLIGAPGDDWAATDAGIAYLFSANGTLLTTFTNPTPAANNYFGNAVAAVGSDCVLIGAVGDDGGVPFAGRAYLFRTNGTLLTTFTSPAPSYQQKFGISAAAMGSDRVLIGADGSAAAPQTGAAYLFSTNGMLLTTFTNPAPAGYDKFGASVAAVGNRVLISDPYADAGGIDFGAVYLFSTNGTLLLTITNPTPEYEDFGACLATMGNDRVLIGNDSDNTGVLKAGAAYVYDLAGNLILTITNPAPAYFDFFAESVAVMGNDRVLIGANRNTGAYGAGVAYLYGIESFVPGLTSEAVRTGAITTSSLADGAVTLDKLDAAIGTWTRAGDDIFRLTGKVGVGTSTFSSNRLEVVGMVGATAFNTTSDRAAKQNFALIDSRAVLAKVATLPITQWSFIEDPSALHVGPMAQDFRAAFGLGYDDKHIATVDADGVALAAIQGLSQKLEEQRIENAELKQRLEKLEQLMNLKAR